MSVKVRKIYGDTWGIIVHHQGKRWQQAIGAKKAAEIMAAEVQLQLAKGRIGILDEVPTFADCARTWMLYIEMVRSPLTISRYRGLLGRILKILGGKHIDQVTRGDIRDLLLKEYKAGSSKASIGLMCTVISGVFNHAIDDGILQHNPTTRIMARIDIAEESDNEIKPLSTQEMLDALEKIDAKFYPLFKLLFETGCRIGEALALTWGDVDFRNKKISISKTAKDQLIRNTTKTNVRRVIDMSDSLLAVLIGLKAVDLQECQRVGIKQYRIFHQEGRLLSDNTLRRKWSAACDAIGIGHRRLHDIRHTTASLLLARRVPITYVAKMLGHSTPQVTLTKYAHYIQGESEGLINALGNP